MSRKKGTVFSAEQKTKIALELLKEESTVAQLATKYLSYGKKHTQPEGTVFSQCFISIRTSQGC